MNMPNVDSATAAAGATLLSMGDMATYRIAADADPVLGGRQRQKSRSWPPMRRSCRARCWTRRNDLVPILKHAEMYRRAQVARAPPEGPDPPPRGAARQRQAARGSLGARLRLGQGVRIPHPPHRSLQHARPRHARGDPASRLSRQRQGVPGAHGRELGVRPGHQGDGGPTCFGEGRQGVLDDQHREGTRGALRRIRRPSLSQAGLRARQSRIARGDARIHRGVDASRALAVRRVGHDDGAAGEGHPSAAARAPRRLEDRGDRARYRRRPRAAPGTRVQRERAARARPEVAHRESGRRLDP